MHPSKNQRHTPLVFGAPEGPNYSQLLMGCILWLGVSVRCGYRLYQLRCRWLEGLIRDLEALLILHSLSWGWCSSHHNCCLKSIFPRSTIGWWETAEEHNLFLHPLAWDWHNKLKLRDPRERWSWSEGYFELTLKKTASLGDRSLPQYWYFPFSPFSSLVAV